MTPLRVVTMTPLRVVFQVITRRYVSPLQVIAGFDINVCAVAATRGRVVATCTGAFGIALDTLMVTPHSASQNMEYRLFKYLQRTNDAAGRVRMWAPCAVPRAPPPPGTLRGASIVCGAMRLQEKMLCAREATAWDHRVAVDLEQDLESWVGVLGETSRKTENPVTALTWRLRRLHYILRRARGPGHAQQEHVLLQPPKGRGGYAPADEQSRAGDDGVRVHVWGSCHRTLEVPVVRDPAASMEQLGGAFLSGSLNPVQGADSPEVYSALWAVRLAAEPPDILRAALVETGAFK